MDSTRLTTLACYAMCGPFNRSAHITDMVSWNLYLGWYVPGFILNDLWMGFFHLCFPNRPFGYSEYGAEGMPNLHSTHPHRGDHTEEYQAKYHEYMLRCFKRHPWMWATHVWNMFDFAADARDQGGEPGMNHKGLVTFDRKTKKDSKASGYAAPNPWIVAHEIAHLFGAGHTEDASLMDAGGNFLSLTSIMQIRSSCVKNNAAYYSDQDKNTLVGSDLGGNYVYGQKVSNTAPAFGSKMPYSVRIPLGACLALDVQADDAENNRISYATVSNDFTLMPPTFSSRLDFRPQYVADIFYDGYYYLVDKTDIHTKEAGSYSMTVSINDMPDSDILTWQTFIASPFYSNYTTRQIGVDIVGGERFSLSLSPDKQNYVPGDKVRLSWGVNTSYFNSESRLRITLSTDYGKTFNHILAASVPALDGECVVEMPDLKIDNLDVDFSTAVCSVRAGIIRIEEIGGAAYTLSCLTPEGGGGFLLSGSGIPSSISIPGAGKSSADCIYDVSGRKVSAKRASSLPRGIYICNGKRVLVK